MIFGHDFKMTGCFIKKQNKLFSVCVLSNMGCQVFNGEIQNQIDFWPRISQKSTYSQVIFVFSKKDMAPSCQNWSFKVNFYIKNNSNLSNLFFSIYIYFRECAKRHQDFT